MRRICRPRPLCEDGVMYLITARARVFALDAATGREIWNYKYPEPPRSVPGFVGNRGVAVGDGKVFFGTKDNYMVALDQKTGRLLWRVNIDDARQCGCNITAAPLVVKDKVIVGGTGGDGAHRGYITAFSTKNGRLAWRWYVIPGPGEKGNETWKGDSWKFGGGAPWLTGSYDPALNLVYWGTGNAAADFYDADRVPAGADKSKDVNLYTASVVALDADTGKLRWHHQEVPDDLWDYDSAYEVLLMDREIRGRMRQMLVHMNKSGLTSVLDRATGELLGVFSVPEVRTWITGITEDGKLVGRNEPQFGKTTTICPSAAGAKSWNSMAYSPRTGFLYVPVNELCNDVTPNNAAPEEGQNYMNGEFPMKLAPGRTTYSHVDAWDPVTGKRAWSMPYKYVLLASMLATAGDLVFTGNPEGEFFALDAKSGNKLWSYQTGAGHRGAVGFVCGEWTAVHRHVDGMACLRGGRRGCWLCFRIRTGGWARRWWYLRCRRDRDEGCVGGCCSLLALSCAAQNVTEVQQGEQVFAKSCATGYCHGVRGAIERRSAPGGPGLRSGVYQ